MLPTRSRPAVCRRCVLWIASFCLVHPVHAQQDLDQQEQHAIYNAARAAAQCVVRIETLGGLEKVGQLLVSSGPTSGVVVAEDGYIISSAFGFIQQPNSILIQLPDGNRRAGQIVSRDHSRHLVLLKVDADQPLQAATPSPTANLSAGQWAVTVGRTLPGDDFNLSVGIVSAINRIWSTAVQTDANVSPTNYGGALADIYGRVIGILVPLSPDSPNVLAGSEWYDSGIGFAVPLEDILANLERLKEGDLYPGKLGVSIKGNDLYGDEPVVGVAWPKSPAREAGLQAGDRIVAINGAIVNSHAEMKHLLGPLLAGDTIQLEFQRDQQRLSKTLQLTDKLEPYEHPFLGILPTRSFRDTNGGVAIRYVYDGSPAARAGLQSSNHLLEVEGQPVTSADQLREITATIEPGDELTFMVQTEGQAPRSIAVEFSSIPDQLPTDLPAPYPSVQELNEGLPPLGTVNIKLPEEEGDCRAYIPESYDPRFEHALIVVLPVPSESVDELLTRWRTTCDEHRTLLLMPQAKNPRSWLPTETAFIRKTIENLRKDYQVDSDRIVVCGSHNSGSMAWLTACVHRDLVRGVVSINGPIPARAPSIINEPLQRLGAFLVGPDQGLVAQRIENTVERLRATKIPVIYKRNDDGLLDNDLRNEVLRWTDTLDRI